MKLKHIHTYLRELKALREGQAGAGTKESVSFNQGRLSEAIHILKVFEEMLYEDAEYVNYKE